MKRINWFSLNNNTCLLKIRKKQTYGSVVKSPSRMHVYRRHEHLINCQLFKPHENSGTDNKSQKYVSHAIFYGCEIAFNEIPVQFGNLNQEVANFLCIGPHSIQQSDIRRIDCLKMNLCLDFTCITMCLLVYCRFGQPLHAHQRNG